MATTIEAERLLGRSRLFRSRRIVRPDLYGACSFLRRERETKLEQLVIQVGASLTAQAEAFVSTSI